MGSRLAAALIVLAVVACGPGPSIPVDGGLAPDGGTKQDGGDGGDGGMPVSFSGEVLPTLQMHCQGCHGPPSPAGGFSVAGDPQAVYPEVRARVRTDDPPASLLLTKMSGDGHTRFFGPGDVEYDHTLSWIEAGAPQN